MRTEGLGVCVWDTRNLAPRTIPCDSKTSYDRAVWFSPPENSCSVEGDVYPQSWALAFRKYTFSYVLMSIIYTPHSLFCLFCVALPLLILLSCVVESGRIHDAGVCLGIASSHLWWRKTEQRCCWSWWQQENEGVLIAILVRKKFITYSHFNWLYYCIPS